MQKPNVHVFSALVAIGLVLPAFGASCFYVQSLKAKQLDTQPIVVPPISLAGWHRIPYQKQVISRDLVQLKYLSAQDGKAWVVIRRGSILRPIHDMYDCLVANGASPAIIDRIAIPDRSRSIDCSLIRSDFTNNSLLSVMWFQDGAITAPDRWSWRLRVLQSWNKIEPTFQQIQVVVRKTNDRQSDVGRLIKLAKAVRQLSL